MSWQDRSRSVNSYDLFTSKYKLAKLWGSYLDGALKQWSFKL